MVTQSLKEKEILHFDLLWLLHLKSNAIETRIFNHCEFKIVDWLGQFLKQSNVDKVSEPNFSTYSKSTPIFEWCVVKCGFNNIHQKVSI